MAEATAVLEHAKSSDGTRLGYRRSGQGPPLVLVHGTTSAHWSFRFIVPTLVDRFTVYALDRRGRGESGDRADYAIEREFEDLAAVVDSIDEPAILFGHSYGATVALGAALVGRNLHKLILYEPAPGLSAVPTAEIERIEDLVARGERDEAVVHAFGVFGMTPEEVEQMRASPTWPARVAAGAYDRPRGQSRGGIPRRSAALPGARDSGAAPSRRREPRLGARGHRADSRRPSGRAGLHPARPRACGDHDGARARC